MPNNSTTTNMGLTLPTVGSDLNQWGADLNQSLGILDTHNHSAGQGVQVPTAGIDINADLAFNQYSINTLKQANFFDPASTVTTLNSLYVKSNNIWFTDGLGNQIQLTSGGGVAGAPGSITGLSTGDTVVFNHSTGIMDWNWNSGSDNMYMFAQEFSVPSSGGKFSFGQVVPSVNFMDFSSNTFRFSTGSTGSGYLQAQRYYFDSSAYLSYSVGSTTYDLNTAGGTGQGSLLATTLKLQDPAPGANTVNLGASSGLAASYSLTLPAALPASTKFVTLDTSGNVGTASSISAAQIANLSIVGGQLANSTITSTQLGSGAVTINKIAASAANGTSIQVSGGALALVSGGFTRGIDFSFSTSTSGNVYGSAPGFTSQTGRVRITLMPRIDAATSYVRINTVGASSTCLGLLSFVQDASVVARTQFTQDISTSANALYDTPVGQSFIVPAAIGAFKTYNIFASITSNASGGAGIAVVGCLYIEDVTY